MSRALKSELERELYATTLWGAKWHRHYLAAQGKIEKLRRELEEWAAVANREDECRQMWQRRAEAAEADLKRAREALKPFAEKSRALDEAAAHFGHALPNDAYRPRTSFTHGQLRHARAAYFSEETEQGTGNKL